MINWIKNNWYRILTMRLVYHSLFWLVILALLIAVDLLFSGGSFGFVLSNQLINVVMYGLLVYFNIFYLIPYYLTQKKFLTYTGLFLLAIATIAPLKTIVFFFKFSGYPDAQNQLVENLNLSFLPAFAIASASTIFKVFTDWVRQLRERQELETQNMQSELRFLKSQINPHFLFNTLNNLYALTLKKSDLAPEIVLKLSEMMRYMLYECNEKRVLLSKEVQYLQNYLDLEKLRQGKNVEITLEVSGALADQKIAPLMFIPFVENSFKHGLNNQISQGFVRIRLLVESKAIWLDVENSKAEMMAFKDPSRPSGGIGLVNVRRRLDLVYPNRYRLSIDDNPKTYCVHLEISLEE